MLDGALKTGGQIRLMLTNREREGFDSSVEQTLETS